MDLKWWLKFIISEYLFISFTSRETSGANMIRLLDIQCVNTPNNQSNGDTIWNGLVKFI